MEEKNVNRRQREFYNSKKKNRATRIWSYFRNGILNDFRKSLGMEQQIVQLHKTWCGDLANKKVLDLGCYEGNSLSYHLAKNSKKYIAIDLSEKGISRLNMRIKEFKHAHAYAVDFLSEAFAEKEFDLIYAYGVLHHFKDVDELINRLNEKLASGGVIVSHDPLRTSGPVNVLRGAYRPFQSDRDWEWPFTKGTYYKFENAFHVKERRAMLGKSKWFFLINLVPISSDKKMEIGKKWHKEDWVKSKVSDSHMFSCMHLSMLMQKKD